MKIFKHKGLRDTLNGVSKIIYSLFISYVMAKGTQKHRIFRSLSKINPEFIELSSIERLGIIKTLIKMLKIPSVRIKEYVIEILSGFRYRNLFSILYEMKEEDSVVLKKKIFKKMCEYVYDEENLKGVLYMYFHLLDDGNLRAFAISQFNLNDILLSIPDCKIVKEVEDACLRQTSIFRMRKIILQLFARAFYAYENKAISRHFDIPINEFVIDLEDGDLYISKLLKYVSRYAPAKFKGYEVEIGSMIIDNEALVKKKEKHHVYKRHTVHSCKFVREYRDFRWF
jgi:hypothetical protein